MLAGHASGAVPWVLGAEENGVLPGVLVDVQDIAAISQGLQKIFDADYPARSSSGVARARSVFSAQPIAERYIAQYHALIGEPAGIQIHV